MSKFLEIVEGNTPDVDLDSLIDAKRTLQRMLIKLGVEVEAKVFKDILLVKLPDGRTVELEIKSVTKPSEEEAEDSSTVISAIGAIAGIPDQSLAKQALSPTARKLGGAKRKMADAADKLADQFRKKVDAASVQMTRV
jgi:hypothetical protein